MEKIFKIKAYSRCPKLCFSRSNFTKTLLTAKGKTSEFCIFYKGVTPLLSSF